jgi:malate synthase
MMCDHTIVIHKQPQNRNPMPQLNINGQARGQNEILTPEALAFLADLVALFAPVREQLLEQRVERQALIDDGALPGFCPETLAVRQNDWQVAPIPEEASDRRTEITGPVSRKMVINALNSGARVFMADFEDSTSPTWQNVIEGQVNLKDAVRRTIEFENEAGKLYRLNENTALLMVRPRGWHLPEAHVTSSGEPIPAALFDFALFLFHNHAELARRGTRPYFYLPKLEHYLEARLWNDVMNHAEQALGLQPGTIKVTVLIETLPAAFQMHEILYELRSRIQGLNCGRWDYIFSYIKSLKQHEDYLLPDRGAVTMDKGFLKAYSTLLIQTCHRRGAMAMGGMAAQIPIRGDEEANRLAMDKVQADKHREAHAGHDGTWVAHPGLEALARSEFDAVMKTPNQIHRQLEDVTITAFDLLKPIEGGITAEGMRGNIRVALQYLAAWLGGNGCVPIDHLMEDAATAEIARAQLWQWVRHEDARLEDGQEIDAGTYRGMRAEILVSLLKNIPEPEQENMRIAADLLDRLTLDDEFAAFLTLQAYEFIV